jgi:hypothetical protein
MKNLKLIGHVKRELNGTYTARIDIYYPIAAFEKQIFLKKGFTDRMKCKKAIDEMMVKAKNTFNVMYKNLTTDQNSNKTD